MPSAAANWRTYLNGRMAVILFLGFSSGLPLFALIYLMQAWLAKSGLDLKALGLFAAVTFPYTFKFLWAPLMDRYHASSSIPPSASSWRKPAGSPFLSYASSWRFLP